MVTVDKILKSKGYDIWSVAPDDTVFEAIQKMEEKSAGALAVLLNGVLVGIISERDYARKVILRERSSKETLVKDIMTRNVYYARPEQKVDECLALMSDKHVRHLPVIEDGRPLGMLSISDVVKEIIAEQKYQIEHLEHMISWDESY